LSYSTKLGSIGITAPGDTPLHRIISQAAITIPKWSQSGLPKTFAVLTKESRLPIATIRRLFAKACLNRKNNLKGVEE
jgi:hypothetical protein